jgi:putative ABC transport system permease protein
MAIGPALIVALNATSLGFSQGITQQFEKLGINTIVIMPASARTRLSDTQVSMIKQIDGVNLVLPFYRIPATLKTGGGAIDVIVTALDLSNLPDLFPGFKIAEGELPTDSDITGAIVGYSLANPSDPEQPSINLNQAVSLTTMARVKGKPVKVTRSYLIKATANQFGQGIFVDIDNGVFISLMAGQVMLRRTFYSGMFVVAKSNDLVYNVQDEISAILGKDVRVISVTQILSTIQSVISGISTFIGAIAFMSVVVAFIGIMTTMFTSVNERTKEIGLLKALGYTNPSIMLIFLSEAALTGLIGGLIGSIAGVALSSFITDFLMFAFSGGRAPRARVHSSFGFAIKPVISLELIFSAIILSVIVAILAGLIPAWRASRLTPVDALRHE